MSAITIILYIKMKFIYNLYEKYQCQNQKFIITINRKIIHFICPGQLV